MPTTTRCPSLSFAGSGVNLPRIQGAIAAVWAKKGFQFLRWRMGRGPRDGLGIAPVSDVPPTLFQEARMKGKKAQKRNVPSNKKKQDSSKSEETSRKNQQDRGNQNDNPTDFDEDVPRTNDPDDDPSIPEAHFDVVDPDYLVQIPERHFVV